MLAFLLIGFNFYFDWLVVEIGGNDEAKKSWSKGFH